MTRAYPIPSSMAPEQALTRVTELFHPWGYRWIDLDHSERSVLVDASELVFAVIEPAIRFEMHETRGCGCMACRNHAEVANV